jgi:flagellar basal body-associated protein FliL
MKKNIIIIIIGIVLIGAYVVYYYTKPNNIQNEIQESLNARQPIYYLPEDNIIENFIPSNSFQGSKQGYVFKTGDDGLGYYVDKYNNI